MTSPTAALAALRAEGDPAKAAEMARYHKTTREVFGVANPIIDALAKDWRAACESPSDRVALADALWRSEAFEACIAAAKLLTQARIPDDGPVWDLIAAWVPEFDGWAIADHACSAAARRLSAVPDRLDDVEPWTQATSMWTRRAALVATQPRAKLPHTSPAAATRRAFSQKNFASASRAASTFWLPARIVAPLSAVSVLATVTNFSIRPVLGFRTGKNF